MVLAIAALFLQLAPSVTAIPDVVAAPVVKISTPADSSPIQPDSRAEAPGKTTSTENIAPSMIAVSLDSSAQNSQSLSTLRVPEAPSAKSARVIAAEGMPSRRSWLILSIAQHSAATFDAYSTRRAVASGAVEADPLLRPFAHSPGIYAAIQVGPAILDFAARRMQRSQNNFLRHTWWLPQSASTGLFLFSGVHNIHVANRP
jgi:hypothetical protein